MALRLVLATLPLMAYSLWIHGLGLGWLPGSLAAYGPISLRRSHRERAAFTDG